MDWFLYDNGLRHERVKMSLSICHFIQGQAETRLISE